MAGLIKAFHIAELSIMFALLWIVYYQGMEWNGLSHNHPAFAYSRVTLQLRLGKTG